MKMPAKGMNEIAEELLRLSREGKLKWEQTVRDDRYRIDFPDVSLAIAKVDVFECYQLDLVNETGAIIDTLATPFESPSFELKEIYELAETYVREAGINRALDYLKRA